MTIALPILIAGALCVFTLGVIVGILSVIIFTMTAPQ